MAYTQETQYFSVTSPLGKDKLLLKSFYGEEGISRLFRFNLEMVSEDRNLDFSKIVGETVTLKVQMADGSFRYVHGVVGRFLQAGTDKVLTTYRAEVHPWLWLLTMSVNCQIFQNKTTPQIIEQVFQEHGFSDFKNKLMGSYQPREYCVQYNESAFDFVSRLMEDEGIFYFFEHQDGVHKLVLADDLSAFQPCPGASSVRYSTHGLYAEEHVVTSCTLEGRVTVGICAHDDFNFETPSSDLIASIDSAVAKNGAIRRVYEYPGGFMKKDLGDSRANLRVQGRDAEAKVLRGESTTPGFVAGHKFTLKEHYRPDVNDTYVICSVSHSGGGGSYTNSFEAFPATVPFRPARTTKKPVIPGTQTAIVVGKAGEEIWTDKYGRVKVQFHWDQLGKNDENSSCWIRVAHGWAGKSWGLITIPRIGQEVVVSFLEGDPDRPLITGSVYNAEQTVPYGLPPDQTRSTLKSNSSKGGGGYNEIRFEDKKGSEEIFVHGQKDENIVIENDKTESVGHDETIVIGNDRTETVKHDEKLTVDNDRMRVVGVNETISIGKDQKVTVGKNRVDSVGENEDRTVGKNQSSSIGDNRSADVGKNDVLNVGKNLMIDAGDSITVRTGSATITMKKDGTITIDGKNISINGSGKITGKATGNMVLKASKILQN